MGLSQTSYQEIHKEKFNEKTIIMGDFNSSSLWDNKHGKRTHSKVVNYLKEIGLESVYHYLFNYLKSKKELIDNNKVLHQIFDYIGCKNVDFNFINDLPKIQNEPYWIWKKTI